MPPCLLNGLPGSFSQPPSVSSGLPGASSHLPRAVDMPPRLSSGTPPASSKRPPVSSESPRRFNAKPAVLSAPCSPELKEIVQSLVARAYALRTGRADPREDNMLLVTTDGRKAALDLRLHDPRLPDYPASKLNQAVAQIESIWRDTSAARSAQLVFCDLSVPTGGRGFSVYEDMRDKLLARGVPAVEAWNW